MAAGFVLLVKGADFFVDGSSSVAKILRVPSVVIGLTVVAFGTSMPEAAVSINAAVTGNNGIAVGNIIGSNIFNLLAVIGICSLFGAVPVEKKILRKDYVFSVLITILLAGMMQIGKDVGRLEGFLLLGCFLYFLIYSLRDAQKGRIEATEEFKALSVPKSLFLIVVGLGAIVFGGDLVVRSASSIASAFGLSQEMIGLTIVAVGTSLPELVTSIVAANKGENDLALGNVIGSNIFNILFILGVSTAIRPIPIDPLFLFDVVFLLLVTLLAWWFAGNDGKISRREGIPMLGLYLGHLIYVVLR